MVAKVNFVFALLALVSMQVQSAPQNGTAVSAPQNSTAAGTKTASRMDLHYGTAQAHGRKRLINVYYSNLNFMQWSYHDFYNCDFQRVKKVV